MRNLELAEETLVRVENDSDAVYMDEWALLGDNHPLFSCGTRACLAGHVLIAAGGTISGDNQITMPGGETVTGFRIGRKATLLLGLTDAEYFYDPRRPARHIGSIWGCEDNLAAIGRFRAIIEAERARRAREDQ